ncbi:hypothetical protein SAMN05660420_00245 [Desulfuromusa kysingii]|uniref:Uncharacterized protein n=1 Tax=Desulfuromusa kysingii TaxID=37625 RepID=A0A1H3VRV5_9BACT|nr:hypothetical protein [Desulfuromusa kysingii]SDZ77490.1 hypothetical protein SAMN05660420_00245 [Desulfuromusa kysingii]
MPKSSALLAVCFVAGLLGALASCLFLWGCNELGITRFIGVNLVQSIDIKKLYPQIFIGGLWGLGYFFTVGIPRHRRYWVRKGIWFSAIMSLTAIFYLYPYVYYQGVAGINLGILTPLLIILANMVWGVFTGFFARLLWGR